MIRVDETGLKDWRWHASVSHDGDDVIATVIALMP